MKNTILLFTLIFLGCSCSKEEKIKIDCSLFLYNGLPQTTSINYTDHNGTKKVFDPRVTFPDSTFTYVSSNPYALVKNKLIQIRAGDFFYKDGTQIRVAVIDYNGNGVFNETGKDYIWIGEPKDSIDLWEANLLLSPIIENMIVSINNSLFSLEEIAENGNSILFSESKIQATENNIPSISFNSFIPNIPVVNMEGETITLNSLHDSKTLTFIDTWFNGCSGCIKELPMLDSLYSYYGDKIKIIGLNTIDDITTMKSNILYHNMQWPQIRGDINTVKTLGIQNMSPNGILYDKNGTLIARDIKVDSVFEYINQNH